MADLVLLPAATYRPEPPSQGRRPRRSLNTIIEEEEDPSQHGAGARRQRNQTSNQKIEAWLSPLSDHFPTPRGFHFLAAPILPSSPSSASADDTNSPANSSNPWNNRSSVMTDSTEFDDLYDATDDEEEQSRKVPSRSASIRRNGSTTRSSRAGGSVGTRKSLPPLVIPNGRESANSQQWSGLSELKKITSPVPPTPPTRVDMSPEALYFMQSQQAMEVPTISAPPSLDGSLSSEQLAQISAPPTPIIGSNDDEAEEAWSGVQLQPGALATLQSLSVDEDDLHEQPEQVFELPQQPVAEMRQQPPRLFTNFERVAPVQAELSANSHRRSLADLTKLDIPSPGGFFSGLSPRTRNTWHMSSIEDVVPPTSTTAEQFYRAPWNMDQAPPVPRQMPTVQNLAEQFYRGEYTSTSPVEQVVECADEMDEDDMPTAKPMLQAAPATSRSSTTVVEPTSPQLDVVPTEIVADYDAGYARQQQEVALSNLDRTELWLMAQRVYLGPMGASQEENEEQTEEEASSIEATPEFSVASSEHAISTTSPPRKKTVRFSEIVKSTDIPRRLPSLLVRQESSYYRAFQDYIVRSGRQDTFVHRLPRFEALQAQRVARREAHLSQLLGKYQLSVVPQSAKKRLSANVARGDDVLVDDPEKLRHEKELEAMAQMAMATWHVAAIKMLNGGRLIMAPVAQRLARLSHMAPGKDGVARDRARILDLGGQATCDWAWHCAMQYPNTKIYTVTTKAIRQMSNCNVRGPPNHRQVAVERLTRLPFADDQFDLISARDLHGILKFVGENGEDEWESCLNECMRVLKPGGYLDFSLLDSDIINAGPAGLAKSVEFGFNLKTLGYDPTPTKMWLGRLGRAGFEEVRRVWTCLPMGERRNPAPFAAQKPLPPVPNLRPSTPNGTPVNTVALEAMVTGSTDGLASVCGLVGSWAWERWLLRCEMEKVSGELRLADTVTAGQTLVEAAKCLDGVASIVEEGRACGAGWRMLNGYARKPKAGTGFIPLAFAL